MLSKKALLEVLEKALIAEEKAVPIYMKHLDSAVFWAGLNKDQTSQIKSTFLKLANESKIHKKIVSNLIEKVKKDPRDAF